MGFVLLLLYLLVSYVRPGEFNFALAPLKITFFAGLIALLASAARLLVPGPRFLSKAPQIYMLFGFLLTIMASRLIVLHWVRGAFLAGQEFFIALIGCILIILNVDTLPRLRILAGALCLLTLFVALECILAYHTGWNANLFVMGQDLLDLEGGTTTVPRVRGLGYLNDPNDLAQALIVAFPLVWMAWRSRQKVLSAFVVFIPSALLLYAIYLTRSRGALLALIVVIGLGLRQRFASRWGWFPALLLAGVLCAGLLSANFGGGRSFSSTEESAFGRLDAWYAGIRMFASHPLFGVGYHGFVEHNQLTAHNSFVLCYAEQGLIGYFFWLGLLWVTFRELSQLATLPANDPMNEGLRRWAIGLRLSLVGFLVSAFFLSRTYTPTLYLILGMAIVLSHIARLEGRKLETPSFPKLAGQIVSLQLASIAFIYLVMKVGLRLGK
jgi:putative inorganic carbon (hco3(-)) transporter